MCEVLPIEWKMGSFPSVKSVGEFLFWDGGLYKGECV